jgi:hypothetical protein
MSDYFQRELSPPPGPTCSTQFLFFLWAMFTRLDGIAGAGREPIILVTRDLEDLHFFANNIAFHIL